jgi:hypothetical protein
MPRGGIPAEYGSERVAPNGYTYVKVSPVRGWVLKHWLVFEEKAGRLVDSSTEQIRFADADRTNFAPENIISIPKGKVQLRGKLARLYAARTEVQAQIDYYEKQLEEEMAKIADGLSAQ